MGKRAKAIELERSAAIQKFSGKTLGQMSPKKEKFLETRHSAFYSAANASAMKGGDYSPKGKAIHIRNPVMEIGFKGGVEVTLNLEDCVDQEKKRLMRSESSISEVGDGHLWDDEKKKEEENFEKQEHLVGG